MIIFPSPHLITRHYTVYCAERFLSCLRVQDICVWCPVAQLPGLGWANRLPSNVVLRGEDSIGCNAPVASIAFLARWAFCQICRCPYISIAFISLYIHIYFWQEVWFFGHRVIKPMHLYCFMCWYLMSEAIFVRNFFSWPMSCVSYINIPAYTCT